MLNRRTFLKNSVIGATAAGLSASSRSQVKGANADIRVAVIGFRGRGKSHIADLLETKGVRIVALCDVDETVLKSGAEQLAKKGFPVKTYRDVRKLLESNEIDAVSTATPNHWHALISVWACQAGKDVYVEKPVSHGIWEGRQIVEAARKYNRIVQSGTQARSDTALQEAVAWVRAGHIGKITLARGLCYKRRPSIGKVTGPQPIPAELDFDLWTGPAELTPLMRKKVHYDWHWDFNTGNGDLGNQGIHQMDVALWFLGEKTLPSLAMSVGGRVGYVDDGNTPNTQVMYLEYPSAPIVFEVRGLPTSTTYPDRMDTYLGAAYGNTIHCEQGVVVCQNAGTVTAYDRSGMVLKTWYTNRLNHHTNWAKAMRSRKSSDLTAEIMGGHVASALCHAGNISHLVGKQSTPGAMREKLSGNKQMMDAYDRMIGHLKENKVNLDKEKLTFGEALTIDPKTERFTNSEAANALLKRNYRAKFVLPEKV